MSSEVHKYIEKALEKNENLFNAEVLDFPNDKKISEIKNLNTENQNIWKINDKSNESVILDESPLKSNPFSTDTYSSYM